MPFGQTYCPPQGHPTPGTEALNSDWIPNLWVRPPWLRSLQGLRMRPRQSESSSADAAGRRGPDGGSQLTESDEAARLVQAGAEGLREHPASRPFPATGRQVGPFPLRSGGSAFHLRQLWDHGGLALQHGSPRTYRSWGELAPGPHSLGPLFVSLWVAGPSLSLLGQGSPWHGAHLRGEVSGAARGAGQEKLGTPPVASLLPSPSASHLPRRASFRKPIGTDPVPASLSL